MQLTTLTKSDERREYKSKQGLWTIEARTHNFAVVELVISAAWKPTERPIQNWSTAKIDVTSAPGNLYRLLPDLQSALEQLLKDLEQHERHLKKHEKLEAPREEPEHGPETPS